jgi:hypothetical protein
MSPALPDGLGSENLMNSAPDASRIDVVYTWVNGDDPAYAAIRNDWARRCGVPVNPERDRDQLDLLKYSLRSLEAYLPWFGALYIVTARPQAPGWLKVAPDNPRLRLVHHDEIFADREALPTFNNFAIENNLHRIPGLAPHFLYMNDDYLFGRPMKKTDFLAKDGRIRIYLEKDVTPGGDEWETLSDPYGRIIANTNRLLERRFGKARRRHYRHGPVLFRKETLAEEEPAVRQSIRNRFRAPTDIAPDYWYCQRVLADPAIPSIAVPLWQVYLQTFFAMVNNDLAQQKKNLRWVRWLKPKFYCLNDDMGPHPNPEVVSLVRGFLDRTYPLKSRFEK